MVQLPRPEGRFNYAAKTGHLFIIVRTDDGRTVLAHKKQVVQAAAASFKQETTTHFKF